jgi:hypothetical protein
VQDVLEDCRDLAATSALWHLCNVCSRQGNVAVCNLGMHPAPLPKGHATLREQHLEWLHRVGHNTAWSLLHQKPVSLSAVFVYCCLPFFTVGASSYAFALLWFATLANFLGVFTFVRWLCGCRLDCLRGYSRNPVG